MNSKETTQWFERAEDSLLAARVNFEHDLLLATVNRSYYTMFYCVSALLFTENVFTKSHSGLINKFNLLFIKTNKIEAKYGKIFHKVFKFRQTADYDLEVNINEFDCMEFIENAEEFYSVCKNYIENL